MAANSYRASVPLTVEVFADGAAVAKAAATFISGELVAALKGGRPATLVLSGGTTPKSVFRELTTMHRDDVDWRRVHFFFGDERPVPPDHPDSNYRMAAETLFQPLHLLPSQVHRFRGELPPPEAAQSYAAEIQRFFALAPGEFPSFDVLMLGMGDDGHTASLFPETKALKNTTALAVDNEVPKLGVARLTLTYPVLNGARRVLVLVEGAKKKDAVTRVLEGPIDRTRFPMQGIAPEGPLRWFIDTAAAAGLTSASP